MESQERQQSLALVIKFSFLCFTIYLGKGSSEGRSGKTSEVGTLVWILWRKWEGHLEEWGRKGWGGISRWRRQVPVSTLTSPPNRVTNPQGLDSGIDRAGVGRPGLSWAGVWVSDPESLPDGCMTGRQCVTFSFCTSSNHTSKGQCEGYSNCPKNSECPVRVWAVIFKSLLSITVTWENPKPSGFTGHLVTVR